MDKFAAKAKIILGDPSLRRRLFFVLVALAIYRLAAAVPVPGIDFVQLANFLSDNAFLGMVNIFSGGGLERLSVMMLGVGPFITSSIIIQLLTLVFPAVKQLYHEEGEAGRRKIAQYSRLLTVPMAAFQGLGFLVLLERNNVLTISSPFQMLVNICLVVAGAVLTMWIGELISEYGIGNGISLIIFAGIVARLPGDLYNLYQNFTTDQLPIYVGAAVMIVAIIATVVVITEGERPIPVTYAKQVRGTKVYGGLSTYLPIRVNTSGVMPIIFALSLLLFPQMIGNFLKSAANPFLQTISDWLLALESNLWLYGILYFILVFMFTYFYAAVTFDPEALATNLQKSGAFIPGVRPGRPTAEYVASILYRLTLVGASFLGFIAILPIILQSITGLAALAVGGTSLLIVVSVAIDFIKQLEAQASMREY